MGPEGGGGSPGEMCNPYPIAGAGAYEYMEDLLALDACRPPDASKKLPGLR